jgi:hypothetical protein
MLWGIVLNLSIVLSSFKTSKLIIKEYRILAVIPLRKTTALSVCVTVGRSWNIYVIEFHYQPINVSTAGAQAFLMDHT